MIAITKQQRIKKALIEQKVLAIKLHLKYQDSLSDTSDIGTLRSEGIGLDYDKICATYDTLKQSYNDFNHINNSDWEWKINKPRSSEGAIFIADNYTFGYLESGVRNIRVNYDTLSTYDDSWHTSHLQLNTANNSLRKALETKHIFNLRRKSLSLLGTYDLRYYGIYLILSENVHNSNAITIYDVPAFQHNIAILTTIAKLTKVNIIIKGNK